MRSGNILQQNQKNYVKHLRNINRSEFENMAESTKFPYKRNCFSLNLLSEYKSIIKREKYIRILINLKMSNPKGVCHFVSLKD